MTTKCLTLHLLPQRLAIARLDAHAVVPAWAQTGALLSLTRTPTELSIVCEADLVPSEVRAERGYRALRVLGTLEFSETGVLASLAAPLARAGISIFVLSTYDTDYLLLREQEIDPALACVSAAGHRVQHMKEG